MTSLDERFAEEERERLRDRQYVESLAAGVTAISNWQTHHGKRYEEDRIEQRAFQAELRKEIVSLRKMMMRLAALPVGGIAHLVFGQAAGDVTSSQALLPAVAVLILCLAFPEFREVLAARASSSSSSTRSPKVGANGAASDPPAPGH